MRGGVHTPSAIQSCLLPPPHPPTFPLPLFPSQFVVALATAGIVVLLHPPLTLEGLSIGQERECQQNDSFVVVWHRTMIAIPFSMAKVARPPTTKMTRPSTMIAIDDQEVQSSALQLSWKTRDLL